ncbi:MAG: LptF/LptG family permease, partial [Thermodesulfobacteriota bacterium]|nr:LptF/LptG family permease [Thermodesulfobacteriota bacterium]
KKDKVWYKSKDAIYNIRFIDLKKNVLKGFTIFTFNGDFDLVGRIDAKEARWMEGSWLLTSGIERGFARGNIIHAVPFEERTINIPETIDSFKIVEKDSTEMSVSELKTYIRRMEMEGYDTTVLQVDLHSKLSFPVVTLIMTFLGVPFALKTSKFGGIPLCIAVSLLLGFIFWLIIALSVSLGHGGAFPPIVAAWLPNMIFTLLGVYLFITIHY